MRDLFKTEKDKQNAVTLFEDLQHNPAWKLLVEVLNANIEFLREQIVNGTEDETKEDIDRLRDKLKAYEEARDTPEIMIIRLQSIESKSPDFDPYLDVDELKKSRRRATN